MKKKLFTTLLAATLLAGATGFGYGAECSQTQDLTSLNRLFQPMNLQTKCLQIQDSRLQCLSNFARFCETEKIGKISKIGCGTESIENICDIEKFCDIGNIFDKNCENLTWDTPDRDSGSEVGGTPSESESMSSESTSNESTPTENTPNESGQESAPQIVYRAQVVNLVNAERASQGLSSLATDAQLTKLAQLKAEDMAENEYFSHTSPTYGTAFDMMKTYGVFYAAAGENIAMGQKTAEAVMEGWMNSAGHRANILNSAYTSIGVGYAKSSEGVTYWVQIFKG